MAKTRATLELKLGELKSRFSTSRPAANKRKRIVAKKKKSASKRVTASASKTGKKVARTAGKVGRSASRAAGKVATKARKVMGEVLSGAATGALKGAAEVVEEKAKKVGKSKK